MFGIRLGTSPARIAVMMALAVTGSIYAPLAAASDGARILYAEPLNTTQTAAPSHLQKSSTGRALSFQAFGKQFELTLEPNDRLQKPGSDLARTNLTLYRGRIADKPGSWVRIATQGSAMHGLVWDGAELYVIESTEDVRDALVSTLDPNDVQTVMFRLADTLVEPSSAFCSSPDAAMRGDDAYDALLGELSAQKRSAQAMQATSAPLRLEISAIGDAQFRAQFDSDAAARDAMLVRLNNVDGIFSAQFGVEIAVPTTLVYGAASDPLSTTTSATSLLDSLANLRQNSAQLNSAGLTHLFTGRDLDGHTVGIGYVDTLCRTKFGAGLTEIRGRGAWIESLIAAHEVGHNFGSVHDGEGQCSSIPQNTFLMSPSVLAANSSFSSCSRDLIQQGVARASCVTAVAPSDLTIAADLGETHSGLGRTIEWEVAVSNVGGRAAQTSHVSVTMPAALTATDVRVTGGTCSTGAGAIECELGDVQAGETRSVFIGLTGTVAGSVSVSAQVTSIGDANLLNNRGEGTITVRPELDLAVTLQAPSGQIDAGTTFTADFVVTNTADIAASQTSINFVLPANLTMSSATLNTGSCTVSPTTCTIASLAPGASVSGTLRLAAASAGAGEISAQLSGAHFDPNKPNDVASQSVVVVAPKTAQTSSNTTSGGGGGGSVSLGLLLALGGIAAARKGRA